MLEQSCSSLGSVVFPVPSSALDSSEVVVVTLCLPAEPPLAALQPINVPLPGGIFVYPLIAGFSLPRRAPEQLKL